MLLEAEEVQKMRYVRLIPWLLMAASCGVTGLVAAHSSDTSTRIYVVDFMKVEPGGGERYLEIEKDWWKPVHEERIRRGSMRSWSLYQVRYPDGAAKDYDFVTVNVFDTFAESELDPFAFFAEVHPNADAAAIEEDTLASRRMVRGEIWYRVDHLE